MYVLVEPDGRMTANSRAKQLDSTITVRINKFTEWQGKGSRYPGSAGRLENVNLNGTLEPGAETGPISESAYRSHRSVDTFLTWT